MNYAADPERSDAVVGASTIVLFAEPKRKYINKILPGKQLRVTLQTLDNLNIRIWCRKNEKCKSENKSDQTYYHASNFYCRLVKTCFRNHEIISLRQISSCLLTRDLALASPGQRICSVEPPKQSTGFEKVKTCALQVLSPFYVLLSMCRNRSAIKLHSYICNQLCSIP